MTTIFAQALAGAVAAVAKRTDVPLDPSAAPAVAEALAQQLPAPQAMESLWPQVMRQGLVFVGGVVVATGWVGAEDYAVLSGAVIAAAPVVWRIATTLLARRA